MFTLQSLAADFQEGTIIGLKKEKQLDFFNILNFESGFGAQTTYSCSSLGPYPIKLIECSLLPVHQYPQPGRKKTKMLLYYWGGFENCCTDQLSDTTVVRVFRLQTRLISVSHKIFSPVAALTYISIIFSI